MKSKKLTKVSSDTLSIYLKEIARIPRVSVEEEKALGARIRGGDEEALRQLVEANLRFVVAFAKKYRGGPLGMPDLINEGNLGLIEAAKRFDPDKGVKFITYASWWIRQAIIHAISEQGRTIRLPQRQANLIYQLGRYYNQLKNALNRDPTAEEVAREMDIPVAQADELLQFSSEDVSLDAAVDEESEIELKDIIGQTAVPPADIELIRRSFERQIRELVDELSPKERLVIQERFGLVDEEPKTLQEIGERMGITRERVRQIEQQAMKKLRHNIKCRQLLTYLN